MAAEVDYGAITPTNGIYGIYNDFYVRITRTVSTGFKLKYRIKVTVIADTSYTFERDVTQIDEVSIVNPVQVLRDNFFRSQVIGLNGRVLDDSATVDVANFGCNRVTIEVGEVYANTADVAATFRGYNTSTNVTFYNGYENVNISNTTTDYANYLDLGWYSSSTIKLNHTILNRKIGTDDENKVFFPSVLERSDGTYLLNAVYTDEYNAAGTLINEDTESATALNPINGYQVFNFLKTIAATTGLQRIEQYCRYRRGTEDVFLFTEKIAFTFFECNKNERYRLRWINRYGTFEYLNCNGTFVKTNQITKGKEIITDGIDLTASTFEDIKSVARPELREYGAQKQVNFSLFTNYLTEEEQLGLSELMESPNTIFYDPDNNIVPVISQDRTFKIASIKDGLIQYELRFKLANQGKTVDR